MTEFAALDLSLAATGAASTNGAGPPFTAILSSRRTGCERLVDLRHLVLEFVDGCALVVIEGYSMGTARQPSRAHALGELGGVVRVALHEQGIPFVEVAPATVKKLATGKGNASKDEVFAAAIRRLGYDGTSKDEADARWLLEAALQAYGHPAATFVPEFHRAALAKVQWPELVTAVAS